MSYAAFGTSVACQTPLSSAPPVVDGRTHDTPRVLGQERNRTLNQFPSVTKGLSNVS